MRMPRWLPLVLLLAAAPAAAKEPKCPLPMDKCLEQFGQLRHRPWLGIEIDTDSTGRRMIVRVVPGGPAEKAGVRAGDVLEKVDGLEPKRWVAGKAGWKDGPHATMHVEREGAPVALDLQPGVIPEDYLARIVGQHMLEAHLAYMVPDESDGRN